MPRPDKKTVVVLEEQWPIACIHGRSRSFWFDGVVEVLAFGKNDCHSWKEGALRSAITGTRVLPSLWIAGVVEHEVLLPSELWAAESLL